MAIEFLYRSSNDPDKVTKRVIFTGYGTNRQPIGRVINHRDVDLGAQRLSKREREAFAKLKPDQTVVEMGKFDPYESIHDHARRLGLIRSVAPLGRSGRGKVIRTVVSIVDLHSLALKGHHFRRKGRQMIPSIVF